jgi:GAF domain-containing protein
MAQREPNDEAAPPVAASLAGILLSESTLDDVLVLIAGAALTALPAASDASVTLSKDGSRAATAAHAGGRALRLDNAQYDLEQGPCLDAAETADIQLVADMTSDGRWPDWAPLAIAEGVHSALAIPLRVHDFTVGVLNLYSPKVAGFGPPDVAEARNFASYAAVALANADLYARTSALAADMAEAMRSRAAIEQAKGILMALHSVDQDEAFGLLVKQSQGSHRKLREVAQEFVDSAVRPVRRT